MLTVGLQEPELVTIRSALSVLIDWYEAAAGRETVPGDRADLANYRDVGTKMLDRFRRMVPRDGAPQDVDLTPGDLSVLERALRMSAAKWQAMIKPSMSAEQKAFHRGEAQDVNDLITRLRRARGLPW